MFNVEKEIKKIRINGELSLFVALNLLCIGVAFFIICNLGMTTVQAPSYVLSLVIPNISIGSWNFIIQFALFIVMIIIVKKIKLSYIISFITSIIYSLMLDFYVSIINFQLNSITAIILLFIAGYIVLSVAVALFFTCNAPLMPYDMFLREIVKYKKLKLGKSKLLFDIICVLTAVVIGLIYSGKIIGVGIGTLIFAVVVGPTIAFLTKFINKRFEFKSFFDRN